MATKDFKRKLTAILSADVKGYSRLMGEDEAQTVKTITAYREVMSTLIKQHRGRVIDSPGDNLLAEFASVVDAVQCAVAVQKEFHARNAELPENRRMVFRIGINLGDVIQEGERIYGDGVNIAARLESLADPGGICVSKTAFDQIETKLPLGYEYLGDQTVKNIAKPVGAYRVLMEPRVTVAGEKEKAKLVPLWRRKAFVAGGVAFVVVVIAALIWNFYFRTPPMEVAPVEKMAFPLPDKPSIAVLPFVNMSEDPKQEYFSDGLTDQIINGLSKIPHLFVIARNSTFTYKGKPVKVQKVAEDLGVKYVLEGSVQKTTDRIRVTAQLINAITGHHIWSERYDRDLKDIFALQDEITMKVVTAMQVKLTEGEQARLYARTTDNLEAYLKYLEGWGYSRQFNREKNALARQIAENVISLDPEYAYGYSLLAWTHMIDVWLGMSKFPKQSLKRAFALAQKAIEIDSSLQEPHRLLAHVYVLMRRHDAAISEGEKALELDPGSAGSHLTLGHVLLLSGRPQEAITLIEKAIRLNPYPPSSYLHNLAGAYRLMGRHDEAIRIGKKAIEREPSDQIAWIGLVASYSLAGRMEEARAAAQEIPRLNPKFSVEGWAKTNPYIDKTVVQQWAEAFREAGLK